MRYSKAAPPPVASVLVNSCTMTPPFVRITCCDGRLSTSVAMSTAWLMARFPAPACRSRTTLHSRRAYRGIPTMRELIKCRGELENLTVAGASDDPAALMNLPMMAKT